MNFRTISQLPQFIPSDSNQLGDGSLLEVSKQLSSDPESPIRYQSYKITISDFSNDIVNRVQNKLSSENSEFGSSFWKMWRWLTGMVVSGETILSGNSTFENAPKSNEIISSYNNPDFRLVNVESMRIFSSENSPLFIGDSSQFSTSYFNVENNLTLSSNEAPSVNGEKHNEYLFRINRTTSNEWAATDSGMFTCYGWVDEETEGEPDNARRWIALEGLIGGEWRILQLQPFIHNLFCSYVSFSFPVSKGFRLRLRTGFRVGTNSNKYQSMQGSLTNHIANAFVGGVYRSVDLGNWATRIRALESSRDIPSDIALEKITEKPTTKSLKDKINQIIDYLKLEE